MVKREFGSEYDQAANASFLCAGVPQLNLENALTYRSGRDALKAAALVLKGGYGRVLLPALCCESMVSPFTKHGITPVFYRSHPDYTADLADVREKLTDDSILLYEPYFGIDPFRREDLLRLKEEFPGVVLLEDRTQDLLRVRTEESLADITVASIRKWTAVPDGGLLWSHRFSPAPGINDPQFGLLRHDAFLKKTAYHQSGDATLKDEFRHAFAQANELLDVSPQPVAMGEESLTLLKKLDFAKIYALRQENARTLLSILKDAPVTLITEKPEISTLYFPVLVEDQSGVQSALAKMGIYCPVIWPVPEEALGICLVAEHTAAHMLGIPCDHRYTPKDMKFIGESLVRTICNE